jgi:phage antirepressor YoqD-like protein
MSTNNQLNQVFNYNGTDITFLFEDGNVMVNLTEVAKAFPEKNLSDIINSKEISEYIEKLSEIGIYSSLDLLIVTKGNYSDGRKQGTWAHQKVALRVCQKLSTQFSIWVDTKIEELLTTGVTTVSNDDDAIIYAMQVLQKRVEATKQRIRTLEKENEQLASKAEYCDRVLQSSATYTMTQVAKELGMSAVALEKKLRSANVMFKQSGQWILYAKHQDKGYTKNRTHHYTHSDGTTGTNTITVWTEKGRAFVHHLFDTSNSQQKKYPEVFAQ